MREVVVAAADGSPAGSNLGEEEARRLADGARRLLAAAEELRPGVAQLEVATTAGSVFVVREGERLIAATTTPEPTVGLVFYDLKTCIRSIDEPKPRPKPRRKAAKPASAADGRAMPRRKVVTGFLLAAGSLAGSVLVRRRASRRVERVDLYGADGSMQSFPEGTAEAARLLPLAHELLASGR